MKFNLDKSIGYLRIVLILFFWSWGLVWFSGRAEKRSELDRNLAEEGVIFAREVPAMVKLWLKENLIGPEHQELLLESKSNLAPLGKLQNVPRLNDHLYLLHYRYEGKNAGSVYLQNIKTGKVAKTWRIPLEEILKDLQNLDRKLGTEFAQKKIPVNLSNEVTKAIPAIQISAPIMGEDSSLIFNCGHLGYVYKLDKNSRLVWKSEELSHHSIELDQDGKIWTCSVKLTHPLALQHKFREDAVLCLDSSGKKSRLDSLSDILTENDLFNRLVAATPAFKYAQSGEVQDPYHLNDVLPAKSDSKFWKKGDLFLSLRHKSAVVQYRPKNGTVIWYQQGPWLGQHDIHFVNDSTISVFNNNVFFMPETTSDSGSNIAYYNFADGSTKYFGQGNFASTTAGRQTPTVDGCNLIEETNKGVYLLLDATGAVLCRFYIPYYADASHAMHPNWARLYLQSGSEFLLQ